MKRDGRTARRLDQLEMERVLAETLDDGRWQSPFWLEPGLQYVLTFEKSGSFGPDIV